MVMGEWSIKAEEFQDGVREVRMIGLAREGEQKMEEQVSQGRE
jgi:hypothetical protein